VQVSYVSMPSPEPGRVNEDYVLATPDWVVVLDGATAPTGIDSGCIHDVAWYVHTLAAGLGINLLGPKAPLVSCLRDAIAWTNAQHAHTCDLSNPASPSSTVAILRQDGEELDYLALADSPIVFGNGQVLVDDRTAHLNDYTVEGIRAARNAPGGFWVAQTNPDAAGEAVVGTLALSDVGGQIAMLTDGASRWVESFELGTWADVLPTLDRYGADHFLDQVRDAEYSHPPTADPDSGRRFKAHDDATVAIILP
jgi:hypothetical protein